MSHVVLSYRSEAAPGDGNLTGREQLFDKLRDLALQPHISGGAEDAYTEQSVAVRDLDSEATTQVALSSIGLIINRMNRSFNFDRMPLGAQEAMPPILNENAMRSLAFRKQRMWNEVLQPLGQGIPTLFLDRNADVDAFHSAQGAASYIVKPTNGFNGQGIVRLARDELSDLQLDATHILQPEYDFTLPFPAGLRPYDTHSREAFEGWSTSDAPKELRVYGFHSPVSTEVFPVGRALKDGQDHWFFIDPESVPEPVIEQSRAAIAKTAEVSASSAVLATVDSGYGRVADEDPAFHAIELNGKAPYIIGYDKHAGVADLLRDILSQQIYQTVQTGRA